MDIFLYRCLASNLFSLVFVVRGVEELGAVQNYQTTVTKELIDDVTPFGALSETNSAASMDFPVPNGHSNPETQYTTFFEKLRHFTLNTLNFIGIASNSIAFK